MAQAMPFFVPPRIGGFSFKDVAHFFALKAQKNEQRRKEIFLSTPFERSEKQ
jgi:hypothetical protein